MQTRMLRMSLRAIPCVCVAIGTVFNFDCYGLFTLPGTDSDPDPGADIHPKNGYSNDQGSRSRLNSESESVQWKQLLSSTM